MAYMVLIIGLGLCTPASFEGGTHIPVDIDTPKDYPGVPDTGQPTSAWFHVLSHPRATYIATHFTDFNLGPGDYLVISDDQGGQQYELSGKGKMQAGTFWARHIKGDTVVLELIVVSSSGGKGFSIDEYVAGEPDMTESVYYPDDRENAVCYRDSHPAEYERGKAVVRLLTNGSGFCTGSLVSPYGHILTNNHCIYTPEKALNTDFEFMAEAPECDTPNCPNCHPGVVFSGGTLITQHPWLDYSLILLSEGDPASLYGYLEFDSRPAVVGEQIYLPQHSAGEAKEFAIYSSHPTDTGGVARIQSVTEDPCIAGSHLEVGYYADDEPGSSGSPVLATSSHKIIALNHCQGDINTGVPVDLFFDDIENHVLGLTLPGRIAAGSIAVSADSSQPGNQSDQAIDRDVRTQWVSSSAGGPHWLQIDLGLQAPVHGYKVWHASAGGGNISHNLRAFVIESAATASGLWVTEFIGNNPAQQEVSVYIYPSVKTIRHVRLQITDPGMDDTARVCEFEVISEPNAGIGLPVGPNIALEAVSAQASSTYGPEWGAAKAVDGILTESSKWTSADTEPPHTLTIDLGSHKSVAGFILRQPSAAGEPGFLNMSRFAFQSGRSINGPWFTETNVLTDGDADFEPRQFVVPKDLRYVRLLIEDPGQDDIARVPEFEIIAHSGPVALFDASPTTGYPPLAVQFTDLSFGNIESWSWDFGDGQTSSNQNPTYIYDAVGIYTVALTVQGPDGTDTETKTDYIIIESIPADFDEDSDVDQEDFGHLQACFTGAGLDQNTAECMNAKLDDDADVDQDDFGIFQGCMSGANVSPDPTCLD